VRENKLRAYFYEDFGKIVHGWRSVPGPEKIEATATLEFPGVDVIARHVTSRASHVTA